MSDKPLPDTPLPDTAAQSCACNSGLTAAHCCEFDEAAFVTPSDGEALTATAQRAAEALRAGDRATAEALALEVLEQAPHRSVAIATLAEIRLAERKPKAATALLQRLVKLDAGNFWTINKLAMLELGRGNAGEAEKHARHGVRIAPENPQAHNLMGMTMTEIGRAPVGEYHCRKTLELSGKRIPLVLANLATNLVAQGRIDEARALYEESNALAPGNRQTLLAWARMEEADRKLDAAHALLDELDKLAPGTPAVTLTRAVMLGREKKYDEAIATLQAAAEAGTRPLRPVEMLERGRLYDKMGRYDEAWADFAGAKAKLIELTGNSYLEDEANANAQQLKSFFVRDRLAMLPRAGVRTDVAQPIFVLGFPRSGTTLLEQTLTASPMIAAGDELQLIHEIAAIMPRLLNSPWDYPGALAELWMGDQRDGLDRLRDHYLQRVAQMGFVHEGAGLFTDKMPLNEVHLGLIALIFPKAPLIHMVRHPLDIMVSAMSNIFTHGAFCGSALETAAKHLVLSADLVAHYRADMDLNYLAVRYEDVVDDQEATMRRVFDAVGASFDPAVLSFEANARYARTASYAQVTEKLYDRSRYRYRHYLPYLEPALPILAPLIERLGYTIER